MRIRRGVTLVELLVVITILGVLAAMVIPNFTGTREEARLRASARQLGMLMHLAYSQAVTTASSQRVLIEPPSGRYWLESETRDPRASARFQRARELPGSEGKLAPGILVEVLRTGEVSHTRRKAAAFSRPESALPEVRFHPDGTAEGREIRLYDRQGFGLALRVHPATARVSWRELARRPAR